jgi:hypothetical protein
MESSADRKGTDDGGSVGSIISLGCRRFGTGILNFSASTGIDNGITERLEGVAILVESAHRK